MSVVTRNVSEYVRKKGINLSELSRSTKIQYRANGLCKKRIRSDGESAGTSIYHRNGIGSAERRLKRDGYNRSERGH